MTDTSTLNNIQSHLPFKALRYAWLAFIAAALLWARGYEANESPLERAAFEERHRIAYDIYAASALDHAYDLLAVTFGGKELDRQYCFYAQAAKQLNGAQAQVFVWDLLYQDFRVLERHGRFCKVYAKWSVTFVLSHSQHSHIKANMYEAEFDLKKSGDGWKIEGSRILNEADLS